MSAPSQAGAKVALRCEGLHRYLGQGEGRVHVLRGVSFEARSGQVADVRIEARAAVPDIQSIDRLSRGKEGDLAMTLYRRLEDEATVLRFKLIRRDQQIQLSDALPVLENMGLRVMSEDPSQIDDHDGHRERRSQGHAP